MNKYENCFIYKELGWPYGLKPEFYAGNPSLTPSWVNHRKKDQKCAFTEIDSQGVP